MDERVGSIDYEEDLNPTQLEAVSAPGGPVVEPELSDQQLVLNAEADAEPLRAVAQGGVVDFDPLAFGGHLTARWRIRRQTGGRGSISTSGSSPGSTPAGPRPA